MVYIIYVCILLVLLSIEQRSKYKHFVRAIIAILYALLIGLRGESVGVDTVHYVDHYYEYGEFGSDFVEPGFNWINMVVYAANMGPHWFLTIFALISIFFIYCALYNLDSKSYRIAAVCFFFLSFYPYINIMRQMVATSIFIFAVRYIEDRKLLLYVCCVIFASLFHASALVLLPIYFLNKHNLSNKYYFILYIVSFVFIFYDFTDYIPLLKIDMRDYGRYMEDNAVADFSLIGFLVTTTLHVIVLYCMFVNDYFEKYPLLSNLVFMYFFIYNVGIHVPILLRVGVYFQFFVYLMYPLILRGRHFVISKGITIMCIISINLALWINAAFTKSLGILPYNFFWE